MAGNTSKCNNVTEVLNKFSFGIVDLVQLSSTQPPQLKDQNDSTPKEIVCVHCHICNTVVPKAYLPEHIQSSKHTSYQAIASTALERVGKQLLMSDKNGEERKDSSEHFCENCVAIIPSSSRDGHELSMKHKNLYTLDVFLDNFAKFYSSNDKNNDANVTHLDDKDSCPDISIVKVNKRHDAVKIDYASCIGDPEINNARNTLNSDEGISVEDKLKEAVSLIGNIENCLDKSIEMNNNISEADVNDEANVVNNLMQYIKLLKKYGPVQLHALGMIDQHRVRIVAEDGTELVVPVNNFHGFKRTGKKYVQCKLCRMFVTNVNDHIVSDKHIRLVAQPFEDKHCVRIFNTSWSHCVICNEVISNTADHVRFNEHIRKLEQTLIHDDNIADSNSNINASVTSNSNPSNKIVEAPLKTSIKTVNTEENVNVATDGNDSQYFCSTCNKHMHANNAETHVRGIKHTVNSRMVNYNVMAKCGDGYKCKICDTAVLRFAWAVDGHVATSDHINKYNHLLKSNKISKTTIDNLFCVVCDEMIPTATAVSHIDKKSHQIKLASHNISYIASHEANTEQKCDKVNENLDGKLVDSVEKSKNEEATKFKDISVANIDIETHEICENNMIHERDDSKNVKSNEIAFINDNETEKDNIQTNSRDAILYQYEAGDMKLRNDPADVKQHKERAQHKIMDLIISRVNVLLGELLQYIHNAPDVHHHMERTASHDELKCKVCSDIVAIENMEKHTNGLKHIHNYRSLMDNNKLKLKDDKYVCYVCNVLVKNGKELRHIKTEEHETRLESLKNGDYVLVAADVKIAIDKIANDLETIGCEGNNPKSQNMKLGNFISDKTRVALNTNNTDGGNVERFYRSLIDNDKELICVICQVVIQNTASEMIEHASNLSHVTKYNYVMSRNQVYGIQGGFVCGFCECTVENEFQHIVDEKHMGKYISDPKKNFCYTCNQSTLDNGVSRHVTSRTHLNNISVEAKYFFCNVCNVQLRNDATNIQRHNDGFQHKNYCSLLDDNGIVIKNRKCYCQLCDTNFNRDVLEDHVGNPSHVMRCDHGSYQL